jgi:hypothetical protein
MSNSESLTINLSQYVIDPEGGPYTFEGSYIFNGGPSVIITAGIISFQPPDTLSIVSTSVADTGTYEFELYASDLALAKTTSPAKFNLVVMNTAPRLVSPIP